MNGLDKKWPRQPFVGLALAGAIGIVLGELAPNSAGGALALIAILAAIAFVWCNSLGTYAFVAGSFFYLHSLQLIDTPGLRLAREIGAQSKNCTVHGAVISEPKLSTNGFIAFLFQLKEIETETGKRSSSVTIFVRSRAAAEFGDELQLFGASGPIPPPRNPGTFDMRAYLARRDVHTQLFVSYEGDQTLLRHGGGNSILRAAQESRRWLQKVLSRGIEDSPETEGLITGMVLGLRHQTPEDIEEPFQQTGTLHLFAVAGLHVGIVAQLLWIAATIARLRRILAIAFIIPALLFYAAITGLHISSVRAALMSSVLLTGFVVERKVFTLNSLGAAAVLILGWDTNQLFSLGFQLSFAVVAAIILSNEPVYRWLGHLFAADPFLKYVVVVDQDVNILNDEEVLHAIATRVRADTDIFMVTHAKGSPLDPASYDPAAGSHLVTKMGIDATRKSNYPEEIKVPGSDDIKLEDYFPGWRSTN